MGYGVGSLRLCGKAAAVMRAWCVSGVETGALLVCRFRYGKDWTQWSTVREGYDAVEYGQSGRASCGERVEIAAGAAS